MHDEIRRFSLEGELGDGNLMKTRERLVLFVEGSMRDYGFVPALDIEEQFTRDFNPETQTFTFKLTLYGVEVGKEDAWKIGGVMSGKKIPKYTPQTKLSQLPTSVA